MNFRRGVSTDDSVQFVALRLAVESVAELCRESGMFRKVDRKSFDHGERAVAVTFQTNKMGRISPRSKCIYTGSRGSPPSA